MRFKLGHRELLSYLAPLKPCSADASHALLRLRLIGLGTTEPPPFESDDSMVQVAQGELPVHSESETDPRGAFMRRMSCRSFVPNCSVNLSTRCVFGITLRFSRRRAPSRLDLRGQPWEHRKLHGSAWVHRICTCAEGLGWLWYMR